MKNVVLLFTFLFCLFLNSFGQSKTDSKAEVQPEEYSVYKTILEKWFIQLTTKQLVIRKFTSGSAIADSFISGDRKTALLKTFEPETIDDYNSRHNKPSELKNDFGVDMPVNLITDEELKPTLDRKKEKDFTESAIEAMERRYQTKFLITFSRVSFNNSRTLALVHVEFLCGLACSKGFIYIMSKEDNRWIVLDSLHTRMPCFDYR